MKHVLVELPDLCNVDTLNQVRRFTLVITRAAHQHIGLDTAAIREDDAVLLEALDAKGFDLQLADDDTIDEIVVLWPSSSSSLMATSPDMPAPTTQTLRDLAIAIVSPVLLYDSSHPLGDWFSIVLWAASVRHACTAPADTGLAAHPASRPDAT